MTCKLALVLVKPTNQCDCNEKCFPDLVKYVYEQSDRARQPPSVPSAQHSADLVVPNIRTEGCLGVKVSFEYFT